MCDLVFGLDDDDDDECNSSLVCLIDSEVKTYVFTLGDTVRRMLQRNLEIDKIYKFEVVIEGEVVPSNWILEEQGIVINLSLSFPDMGFYYLDEIFLFAKKEGDFEFLNKIKKISDSKFMYIFRGEINRICTFIFDTEDKDYIFIDDCFLCRQDDKIIIRDDGDTTYLTTEEQLKRIILNPDDEEDKIVPFEEFMKIPSQM